MLALTPHMLAAAYDCLREFPPFKRWKLPPGEEVEFQVVRVQGCFGAYIEKTHSNGEKEHLIQGSPYAIGHMNTLMRTLAHEMVHVYQAQARLCTSNTMHNASFHWHARRICDRFGWDYREFV